jgi:hypothetical protein
MDEIRRVNLPPLPLVHVVAHLFLEIRKPFLEARQQNLIASGDLRRHVGAVRRVGRLHPVNDAINAVGPKAKPPQSLREALRVVRHGFHLNQLLP